MARRLSTTRMSSAVHVTGFDAESDVKDELLSYMQQSGTVEHIEMLPPRKGGSRSQQGTAGRAKVTYASVESAERACRELHGMSMYTVSMDAFTLGVQPFVASSGARQQSLPSPGLHADASEPSSGLRLFVTWGKDEPWSETHVRAVFEPHCASIVAIAMPASRRFANVWLHDAKQEMMNMAKLSSKERPVELWHEGWRCWLQPWERPSPQFSWGAQETTTRAATKTKEVTTTRALAAEAAPAPATRWILCTHFPFEATASEIRAQWEATTGCTIDDVKVLPPQPALRVGGRAIVAFQEEREAALALSQAGQVEVHGRRLQVSRLTRAQAADHGAEMGTRHVSKPRAAGGPIPARASAAVGAPIAAATPVRPSGGLGDKGGRQLEEQETVALARRLLATAALAADGGDPKVSELVLAMYRSEHAAVAKRTLSAYGGALKFLMRHGPHGGGHGGFVIVDNRGTPLPPGSRTVGNERVRLAPTETSPLSPHTVLVPVPTRSPRPPPPPPRPPPAITSGVGGGGEGLVQQVERIKATLELPAGTSVPMALRTANAMMGNADDDSVALPDMAARLLLQLGI